MMKANIAPKRGELNKQRNWWCYVVAVVLIVIYLLPFYLLINLSGRTISDLSNKLQWPEVFNWANYRQVLEGGGLWQGYMNSIIIAAETIVIELVVGGMAAYGIARAKNRLTSLISNANMAIMMIPGTALLVGTYSVMSKMGMTNSKLGVALLSAAGGITGTIFFFTNFIDAIPASLDEAAEIDGASVLRTFFSIILPQLKPIIVTRVIMSFIGSWNSYLYPMYLLTKKSNYTVILHIKAAFADNNGTGNIPLAAATCALGILPLIILYLCMQKFIIGSQIDSAIK